MILLHSLSELGLENPQPFSTVTGEITNFVQHGAEHSRAGCGEADGKLPEDFLRGCLAVHPAPGGDEVPHLLEQVAMGTLMQSSWWSSLGKGVGVSRTHLGEEEGGGDDKGALGLRLG